MIFKPSPEARITEYQLLHHSQVEVLEDMVNELLKEGWLPLRGPYHSGTRHYQAMVYIPSYADGK